MPDPLTLIGQFGLPVVFLAAMLACMMIPAPASVILIAAGTMTGTGQLHWPYVYAAAVSGAICGDVLAYSLAARLGARLNRPGTRRAALFHRAAGFLDRRGGIAIFLSRWLVSPMGPPINYVAGSAAFPLIRFLPVSLAGELVWASIHLSIGHFFGSNYHAVEHDLGDGVLLIGVLVIGGIVSAFLWRRHLGRAIIHG